jgi:hypothetical protein
MVSFSRRPIIAAMASHSTPAPRPRHLASSRLGRFAGALAIAVAVSAAGQRSSLDEDAVVQFVGELQRNLARDDRQAIAARVRYPLTVSVGGVRIPISNAAALIEHYDLVFTPALKEVITDARRAGRSGGTALTITPGYASIGNDAVRIEPIDDALTITRITVPLAAAGASDAASRRFPRRIGRTAEVTAG